MNDIKSNFKNVYFHTSLIFKHALLKSCSESLLQCFNDVVITFIMQEKYRNNTVGSKAMKVITASLKRCNKDSEQL